MMMRDIWTNHGPKGVPYGWTCAHSHSCTEQQVLNYRSVMMIYIVAFTAAIRKNTFPQDISGGNMISLDACVGWVYLYPWEEHLSVCPSICLSFMHLVVLQRQLFNAWMLAAAVSVWLVWEDLWLFFFFLQLCLHMRQHVYNYLSSGCISLYIHPPYIPVVIVSPHKSLSCWWGLIPGCLSLSCPFALPPNRTRTRSALFPVIPSFSPIPIFLPTVSFKRDVMFF